MRSPLIAIFILIPLIAYADKQADSLDEVIYGRQTREISEGIPTGYDENEGLLWIKKKSVQGSWRWDFDEFYQSLDGFAITPPEYYYDEEFEASNNGWALT